MCSIISIYLVVCVVNIIALAGNFVLFTAVAMFTLSSDPETLAEEGSRELMSTCAKSDHVLVSCLSINLALSQLSPSP